MATWSLTIDNINNTADKVYVMEDDESGSITTQNDLFYPLCFLSYCNYNLVKRFYASLAIGGDDFPPVCKAIAARGNGSLIVAEKTNALKVWTYNDGSWTAKTNITSGIADRATITIPSYAKRR